VNDELDGFGTKCLWPNLRYYQGICLEGLRKTMKTSEYPVSRVRVETMTSQIQSRNVKHLTMTFDVTHVSIILIVISKINHVVNSFNLL
jgi:hypothetical protein